MRISKKILAIALSILMAVSMMPFTVFAADVDSYQSLVDEVAAFNAGDSDVNITLTADVELQNTITIDTANGKTLTINGGKNITLASGVGSAFYVKQGSLNLGKNTITGAPANYKLIYLTGSTNPQDANYSNVTIAGATINCTNGYAVMISANGNAAYGANITTKSGTVYGYYGALYVNGNVKANVGDNIANVIVNGGTLSSTEDEGTAIYGAGYANYTIKSGTLTAATAAYFKAGNVTISGGTLNGTGEQKAYSPNGNGYEPTGEAVVLEANSGYAPVTSVSITGGTFNSTNTNPIGTYANNASVTAPDNFITGGTFKSAGAAADVSEYLNTEVADKVVDSKGKVVDALFEVNGVKYGHITEAIAAVPTDGTATTIKLLKDVSDSGYGGAKVQAGQNVIFDLDGHTWTLRGTVGSVGTVTNGFQFLQGSTVKIKDGTITAKLASIYTVIQNYADLTIENATIQYTGGGVNKTTVSSNNNDVVIKNSTISMASTQPTSQAISLTPGWAASYKNATMVIEDSAITGAVAVDSQAADSSADLEFTGTTTVSGDIRLPEDSTGDLVVKNTGTGVAAPDGYEWVDGETAGTQVLAEDTHSVAKVNGVKYDTFAEALAAIKTGNVANGEIKLLADCTTDGFIIGSGSDLTIDFNGKTLDINANPVGSTGTESNAMQLLKDSDITFKNGTLTSSYTYDANAKHIQRLIQNYANLTLDHMTVGMKGNFYDQMTMSNCNGDITITNSTVSAPDFTWLGWTNEQAAESLGARAMSVGTFSTYTGVDVTVTDSTINGYVNIDNTGANGTAALTLDNSDVNGNIVDESMNGATVTNTGSTVDGIPAGYEWNATTGVLGPIADGFNLSIDDMIHMNLYVNADAYGADEITVTYSDPEKQDDTTTTDTLNVADLERDTDGRYMVSILAAPAQITDDVTVTAGSHTFTTSVKAYCEAIIDANEDPELVALAQAMLDYGKAANAQFNYADAANFDDYINTADVTDALNTAAVCNVTGTAGVFTGYSYIATSVPSLRIYVSNTEYNCVVNSKMATVNGVEVAPTVVEGTDKVCIDITGILAEDFEEVQTVSFDGATIEINVLQYAKAAGGDLGRSMYNYFVAANAYFD